jgi:pimeloyl-ACP methyl ester carboxylesterase
LVAGVVFVAGACTQGDKADPTAGGIRFGPCGNLVGIDERAIPAARRAQLNYECGTIAVPVDYADPGGERIDIHVVRVRAAQQRDRIGSLIVNFGGPGGSGLQGMSYWPGAASDDILARFDIVSFDPRGTGRSAGIRCPKEDKPGPDPDLSTEAGYAQFAADDEKQARHCSDRLGRRAPHFNTESTALDIDAIRRALGENTLTYIGFSYGAKLGAEYARNFPDRVRAAVLDGPSDPSLDDIALIERQIAGFEDSFARYANSCPARPSCQSIGDPHTVLARLVKGAAADPIPAKKPGDDRVAYSNDILRGVVAFLYGDELWPDLDSALREASADSDSTMFFDVVDQSFGSGTDDPNVGEPREAGFVIGCNDSAAVQSDEQIKAAVTRLIAKYPVFGRFGASKLFGCRHWQPVRHPLQRPTAPDAAPILVIGTVHDPATPYAGAVSLAETLGSGRLLTWDGDGHTAYHQSTCIDRHVDAYLVSLTVPAPGTRCA